ncbi:MAG: hypothetical protein JWP97_6219 [Labilithrix sp.]|nr:hypothetical protein [Labilithrix sp.]
MKRHAQEPRLQPGWLRLVLVSALAALLTVYAWWPMFMAYPKTPEEDGRHFFFQFETVKAAIRTYHELPLWNPFDCHGIPLWNHPESMAGAPILLLTVGLTTTATTILWYALHVAAGFVSMWLLARDDLRLSRIAALVSASMWAFGVAHTSQYAGEHASLAGFLYAPLLLFLWRKAETSNGARVGLGLVIALLVFEGATYPLPYTLLVLGLETLTRIWRVRRVKNILTALVVVGAVSIVLSAARLLPLIDELAAHKRPMEPDSDSLLHVRSLVDMFVLRTPNWRMHFPDQQYVFGEYIAYVGWIGLALVLLGVLVSWQDHAWLLVLSVLVFVFMLGHFASWAPYTFLQAHVLPFRSMRVPSRYRLLLLVNMCLYMGLAVDRLPELVRGALGGRIAGAVRVAVVGCALLATGDAVGLGQEILGYRFNGPPETRVVRAAQFSYGGPSLTPDFIDQPRQNRAWLGCRHYTWAFESEAPVWSGDVPQVRAQDAGAEITSSRRTHNTFTFSAVATRPTRILLNSAWDRGWTTDVGTVVRNEDKLLAIDLPAGEAEVHVRYWPRFLTLGLWSTGAGLVATVLFFLRGPLRRRLQRAGVPAKRVAA